MKKLLFLFLVLMFSCSNQNHNLIGISKIVSHPALDSLEKGIQDELNERKIKVTFDLQNANGDINTALSIAKKFKEQKVKIAVGIATPSAQTLVKELKDTSTTIVFSAVTDPVKAGLVSSLEKGEKNVTGISDMTPVETQIKLITQIKPVKKLGLIYSSHEDNAVTLAKITKDICKKLNIELIEATVTSSSEVKQATLSIVNKVDAIYVTTDNTVVSALPSLTEVTMKYKVPVISADPSSAKDTQVLAALGFDYYKMGKATGKLIIEILEGKKAENIPTRFLTDRKDLEFYINLDVAKKLNLNIPEELLDSADIIVK
ncbi:MAG: ABC transporter substrate-binding protein [Brevinematales bacterium]|nr:ABC transporter substrate-binding protein [Brevinematales bacterium]